MPGRASAWRTPTRRWSESRRLVLGTAAVLGLAVSLLPLTGADPRTVGLLYVLPIILVALELGLVAGVVAAVSALALIGAWIVPVEGGWPILCFGARATALLSSALVAGRFSDRTRAAQRRQERLLESGLVLARLAGGERMASALAYQAQRVVGARGARATLGGAPAATAGLLGDAPVAFPIEGRHGRVGTLEIEPAGGGRLEAEDRAVLALVALQAGVAADNHGLMESERDRAAAEAELGTARRHLDEQRRSLGLLLDDHEHERRDLALVLHEQCAQTLAAVLLGLSAVSRRAACPASADVIAAVRGQVDETLREVRDLAVRLRPPVLDDLGLVAALQRFAREAPGQVAVDAAISERPPRAVETALYRAAESVVRRSSGPARLRVEAVADGCRLEATLAGPRGDDESWNADLDGVRARLGLLGGTLDVEPADGASRVVVRIPAQPALAIAA